MINDYEAKVMTLVCNHHIRKAKTPIIKNIDEFFNRWNKRGPFTPTFDKVCKKALSASQIKMLHMYYNSNIPLKDIADSFSTNISYVSEIINSAIDKLSLTIYFKELFIGTEEYEKMMAQTRKSMSNILKNDKDRWDEIYLDELLLDNRSINIFERTFQLPIKVITVRMALNKLKSLSNINNCGYKTRIRIIETFRDYGIDVSNWDNELKEEMKFSKTLKRNVMATQREVLFELQELKR